MDKEIVIDRLKKLTEMRYPKAHYVIKEYKAFYTIVVNDTQPLLYEKENGFLIMKTFGQCSKAELANPKLIYESGGKDNGKK